MAKKNINEPTCSFCGRDSSMVSFMVPSPFNPATMICNECIESIHEVIDEQKKKLSDRNKAKTPVGEKIPKPKEIQKFLDQYVI